MTIDRRTTNAVRAAIAGGDSGHSGGSDDKRVTADVRRARLEARREGLTIQTFATNEARKFGLKTTGINYKGQDSTERKYRDEINAARSSNKASGKRKRVHNIDAQIRDLARNTIIYNADTQARQGEQLKRSLMRRAGHGEIADYKVQDFSNTSGYRGFMVHIKTGRGNRQGEVQVLSDKMIYAKEKPKVARALIGKKRYNEIRRQTGLPGGWGHRYYEQSRVAGISKRRKETLERKSREYYKKFY